MQIDSVEHEWIRISASSRDQWHVLIVIDDPDFLAILKLSYYGRLVILCLDTLWVSISLVVVLLNVNTKWRNGGKCLRNRSLVVWTK